MTYKVLIVDDSKLARMAIAKALNSLHPDWTRIEASDAEQAEALAENSQIDIALIDLNMPGRDGLTLAAALRALSPGMPLALITANLQNEIVARAKEVGAAFVPKPLNEQALSVFLTDAIQQLEANTA